MRHIIAAATLAAAHLVASGTPAAAATLQVTPGYVSSDPNVGLRSFIPGAFTGPFGQSFTAIDTVLNSIGFQFNAPNPQTTGASYTLSLYAGETLTGTALVTQTFTLPTSINSRTPVWYDIDIGAVGTLIGQRYTATLSSGDRRNGIVLGPDYSYATSSQVSGDVYSGGRFFSDGTPVYSDCPNTTSSPCDLNFRVIGTTVPEPASWALTIGGFGLAGTALRRRRAATVTD